MTWPSYLTTCPTSPQLMLETLSTCFKKLGLSISCKKTKSLVVYHRRAQIDAPSPAPIHLVPGEEPIKVVPHFQYLGSNVQNDCGVDTCKDQLQDLQGFVSVSCSPCLMQTLWHQHKIQTIIKVLNFNHVIIPPPRVLCDPLPADNSRDLSEASLDTTPPSTRWPSSIGSHPFSHSLIFTFLGIFLGCRTAIYQNRFLCLPCWWQAFCWRAEALME